MASNAQPEKINIDVEKVDVDFEEAPMRSLQGGVATLIMVVSIAFAFFQFYTAAFGTLPNIIQRAVHVGFAFFLCFALVPAIQTRAKKETRIPWWDMTFMLLSVIAVVYVIANYEWILDHPAESDTVDVILGLVTIALLLEAGRRTLGITFPILMLVFLLYGFFGPYFPGLWAHRGIGIEEMVQELFLSDRGIWGMVTGISATVVAMFIIFGAALSFTGGAQVFLDFALRIAGRLKGGAGKISVVSSSLFGMISGSAVANVGVDGAITIPMMKKFGYRKELAAAIEATASTGGQLAPPVMGAGAFIMAEMLGTPYVKICAAAAIPAFLYYYALWFSIQFETEKIGVEKVSPDLIPTFKSILKIKRSLPLIVPVLVFLAFLITGKTPEFSCVLAVGAGLVLYFATRKGWDELRAAARSFLKCMEGAGHSLLVIACICTSASVIVGVINSTGLGIKFSELVVSFSGGNLFPALVITMFVSLILGMGVPTTAAYLLAVSVCGTALIRMGVDPLQAHLFVFYFAIISAITPPVAPGIYFSAAIGKADVWISGYYALRLAAAGFIVPFMFVYGGELLLIGKPLNVVIAFITATIGTLCLAGGCTGYFLKKLHWLDRLVLIAAAFLLIKPGWITDVIGLVLMAMIIAKQKYFQK